MGSRAGMLLHGCFGSGKSFTLSVAVRFMVAILEECEAGQGGDGDGNEAHIGLEGQELELFDAGCLAVSGTHAADPFLRRDLAGAQQGSEGRSGRGRQRPFWQGWTEAGAATTRTSLWAVSGAIHDDGSKWAAEDLILTKLKITRSREV